MSLGGVSANIMMKTADSTETIQDPNAGRKVLSYCMKRGLLGPGMGDI